MFHSLLILALGIVLGLILGVAFHASIKAWAVNAWQRYRAWRLNSTRN